MDWIQSLKSKWLHENAVLGLKANKLRIELFQEENHVTLPDDLVEYFLSLNGTSKSCTDDLFEFYPIDRILKVKDEFKNWNGVPNYQELLNNSEVNILYVFAHISFNLFTYAIRLSPMRSHACEVYVLCGKNYKKIAESFSDFVDLYINSSIELQL